MAAGETALPVGAEHAASALATIAAAARTLVNFISKNILADF
jgi:hypothetical protein